MTHRFLLAIIITALLVAHNTHVAIAQTSPQGVPVTVKLDSETYLTLVIEDTQGNRIRNLIGETRLPAGEHTFYWDGYNEGRRIGAFQPGEGNLVQQRVAPGTYRVRGLVHDGLHLTYENTVYYTGMNTPWKTPDGTGAWLADHSSALGVVFIPAGAGSPYGRQNQVLFSAQLAETGHPFAWVDTGSLKTLQVAHYWGWAGANALAYDAGRNARKDIYTYAVCGDNDNMYLRAFAVAKPKEQMPGRMEIARHRITTPQTGEPRDIGISLAVYDCLAVVSVPLDNEIVFFDTKAQKEIATFKIPKPRGLAFDNQGHLYVCSDKQVLEYTISRQQQGDSIAVQLSSPRSFTQTPLEEPYALAISRAGVVCVADHGASHQVKVFSPTGQLLRTIGNPGGQQLGKYDENRMYRPNGLAIDNQNRLWVAENSWAPKRVSLWKIADGSLVHIWYGPPQYGGGGTIDPQKPDRLFYSSYDHLLEFKYHKDTNQWKVDAVVAVTTDRKWDQFSSPTINHPGNLPERALHYKGRTYLVGSWNGPLRGNEPTVTLLYDEKTQTARPVCFVGTERWWWQIRNDKTMQKRLDELTGVQIEHLLAWSDLNADAKVQLGEFSAIRHFSQTAEVWHDQQWQQRPTYNYRYFTVNDDMSLQGSWGLRIPSPKIRPDGTPIYDLKQAQFTIPLTRDLSGSESGRSLIAAPNDWAILDGTYKATAPGLLGYHHGKQRWVFNEEEYPTRPGLIVQPTRLLGPAFIPPQGEANGVWAMSGERGSIFLFTTDGLFIQTIAGDMRTTPLLHLPTAQPGQDIGMISFEDEHFHPSITCSNDGRIRLVAGKEHNSVFELHGLQTVKRINAGTLTVTSSQLAQLPATQTTSPRKQARQELKVALSNKAPNLDGNLSDWADADWAQITSNVRAAMTIAQGKMYLAFQTDDPQLLRNSGHDPNQLFTTGGCLDLHFSTLEESDRFENHRTFRSNIRQGDIRLLITRLGDQTQAMLYRPVNPAIPSDRVVRFDSPIGSTTIDQVLDVSNRLTLKQDQGNYELAIPLGTLNFKPQAKQKYLGDLGIIRSNGQRATQRIYWNNLDTDLVSDVPTEARLQPANWGWFVVE